MAKPTSVSRTNPCPAPVASLPSHVEVVPESRANDGPDIREETEQEHQFKYLQVRSDPDHQRSHGAVGSGDFLRPCTRVRRNSPGRRAHQKSADRQHKTDYSAGSAQPTDDAELGWRVSHTDCSGRCRELLDGHAGGTPFTFDGNGDCAARLFAASRFGGCAASTRRWFAGLMLIPSLRCALGPPAETKDCSITPFVGRSEPVEIAVGTRHAPAGAGVTGEGGGGGPEKRLRASEAVPGDRCAADPWVYVRSRAADSDVPA
jgi:hypothetical protein